MSHSSKHVNSSTREINLYQQHQQGMCPVQLPVLKKLHHTPLPCVISSHSSISLALVVRSQISHQATSQPPNCPAGIKRLNHLLIVFLRHKALKRTHIGVNYEAPTRTQDTNTGYGIFQKNKIRYIRDTFNTFNFIYVFDNTNRA